MSDPGPTPTARPRASRRARVGWFALRLLLVGAVLFFIGCYVADNVEELRTYDLSPDLPLLA
ncbi:MAG: hypothetical protein QGH45_23965, partial [Myxococcota bacterium]|nr:hypothetical protein [Myxococcota bacterium]